MAVFLLEGCNEGFGFGGIGISGIVVGEIGIVQSSSSGDFRKLGAVPTVTADDRNINTELTCLFNNFANLFIVTGNINYFRVCCFDFGQYSFEIRIFLQISFFDNNTAAVGGEGFFEEIS